MIDAVHNVAAVLLHHRCSVAHHANTYIMTRGAAQKYITH